MPGCMGLRQTWSVAKWCDYVCLPWVESCLQGQQCHLSILTQSSPLSGADIVTFACVALVTAQSSYGLPEDLCPVLSRDYVNLIRFSQCKCACLLQQMLRIHKTTTTLAYLNRVWLTPGGSDTWWQSYEKQSVNKQLMFSFNN